MDSYDNMRPEEIQEKVLKTWRDWDWEGTSKSIVDASPLARYLFDGYFFYIPAVNKYYLVRKDGNYYHGYETEIREWSKTEILELLHKRLQLEGNCPYRGDSAEKEARRLKYATSMAVYYKEKIAEVESLP